MSKRKSAQDDINACLRRHVGSAMPINSVNGDDVIKAVRAAYRAGVRAAKTAAHPVVVELEEVLSWARVERAALRDQEITSIARVLAAYKDQA